MKLIDLFERMRQAIPVIRDELEKYVGQKNIFIHFTNVEKIGVNPQSTYKTPTGIYAYPLEYVLSKERLNKLPFAYDYKYVFVLQCNTDILDLQEYEMQDFNADYNKLKHWYISNSNDHQLFDTTLDLESVTSHAKVDMPGGYLWYVLYNLSDKKPAIWNKLLRYLGYNAIVDHGDGVIHSNEPTQALFTSINAISILKGFSNTKHGSSLDVFTMAKRNPEQFYNQFIKGKTFDKVNEYLLNRFQFSLGGDIFYHDTFVPLLKFLLKNDKPFLNALTDHGMRSTSVKEQEAFIKENINFFDEVKQEELIARNGSLMDHVSDPSQRLQSFYVNHLKELVLQLVSENPEHESKKNYLKIMKKLLVRIHNPSVQTETEIDRFMDWINL